MYVIKGLMEPESNETSEEGNTKVEDGLWSVVKSVSWSLKLYSFLTFEKF